LELAIRAQDATGRLPSPCKNWRIGSVAVIGHSGVYLGFATHDHRSNPTARIGSGKLDRGRADQAGTWPWSASQGSDWRVGLMRQIRTFEENLALVKARVQQAEALQAVSANRPLDVQLPLWAEVCRGVPNSVLRSALFGVVRRGPRSFQQRVQKASVEGVKIIHTGPQLDQADLDVWEQALQLARTGGLGCRIQFTASQFLKCIGRGNGKSQHEWLKGAFARLAASVVEIKDGHRAYFGAILSHGGRDDQSGRYVIEMNPKLIELYGLDGWSSVEFGQRMALKKRPLAQWLHGYYSSHAKPFPVKVETLHRLCGSQNSSLKGFKQDLKSALEKLEEVTDWTWKIDDSDLVHLSKLPTASQSRHLLKRGRFRGVP
jgi:hypothetical protein